MSRKAKPWTCRKVTRGVKCGQLNKVGTRKCARCGTLRPIRKPPAHMAALTAPYSVFLAANGGVERCGICGVAPKQGRTLQRDHEHVADGKVRGLLCFQCNFRLGKHMKLPWMRAAVAYLERTA